MSLKDNIILWRDAYVYGWAIGTVITMAYTIHRAALNNWVILMRFNDYGEGALEYALMVLWFILLLWLLVEKLVGLANGKRRSIRKNKVIPNFNKDARKQHYNL